jgi:putative nucleotidyltransferase with HDIG domain
MYRCWQLKQTLLPKIDPDLLIEAKEKIPPSLLENFKSLRKSEIAHTLRVYKEIKDSFTSIEDGRDELLELALLHDIGKGITRHTVFFKIAKVLLPVSSNAHAIAGAKLLFRKKMNKTLVIRVLRHHDKSHSDKLLNIFQSFDDKC